MYLGPWEPMEPELNRPALAMSLGSPKSRRQIALSLGVFAMAHQHLTQVRAWWRSLWARHRLRGLR